MKDKSQDKKLVQARLPFKTLSPHSTGVENEPLAKKRKLSNTEQIEEVVHKKIFVKDSAEIINDENRSDYNPVVRIVDNVNELLQEQEQQNKSGELKIDSDNNDSVICLDNASGESDDSKAKDESSSDDVSQKLDDSIIIEDELKDEDSSTVTTPSHKKLSSKQLQRQQESAKKKEEKEKARLEQKKQKLEEKEQRLKLKQEKEEQKKKEKEQRDEQRKKEKEEKEKQKRLEKEEREKKRLSEIETKNEERRLKEEDRRIKEEEKRKKELEKVEADQRQKKAFVNFFQRKVIEDSVEESKVSESSENEILKFMPFCLKADMKLAPINRHIINDDDKIRLIEVLNTDISKENLYVNIIKKPDYKKGKSSKTWDNSEKDIVIIEDDGEAIVESDQPKPQHSRPKLLQFYENRRPPYWGTWTKISEDVGPRAPFGKDKILDYEVDSDSEWEEEEPGESLHGSDDEKEKDETEDEYEVDNDFFVPHGYLSEEEQNDAEDLLEPNSAEDMKVKLKLLQNEFNEEMKKKTEKIKPRLYGCVWANEDGSKPDKCVETIWNMLNQYSMIYEGPIILKPEEDNSGVESALPGCKLTKFPDLLLPELIKLIHGNENSRLFLIKEFYAYVNKKSDKQDISKSSIGRKIHEIAKYKTVPDVSGSSRRCWFVEEKFRKDCEMLDWPLVNSWNYCLKRKKVEKSSCESTSSLAKKKIDISKFTKPLDDSEMAKQFTPPAEKKKRVTLISVPSGSQSTAKSSEKIINTVKNKENTPKVKSRVNLLTNFINRAEIKYSKEENVEKKTESVEHDKEDCIMLSD